MAIRQVTPSKSIDVGNVTSLKLIDLTMERNLAEQGTPARVDRADAKNWTSDLQDMNARMQANASAVRASAARASAAFYGHPANAFVSPVLPSLKKKATNARRSRVLMVLVPLVVISVVAWKWLSS
ncbi:MAG: hypothetical protein ACRDAM_07205 [Casimicrobium sp.]